MRVALPLLLAGVIAGSASAAGRQPPMRGVNLSGAEFAANRLPGVLFKDYVYPSPQDIDRFAAIGMNTIRLPFLWERLQPVLNGPFNLGELAQIDSIVRTAALRHVTVILDPHDYGDYHGQPIGSALVPVAAFQHFWQQLAGHFRGAPNVAFGLMNEPVKQSAEEWGGIAQATIDSIRQTGARQLILAPGTIYTGAHSWNSKVGALSNGEALSGLRDPANNLAIEVHQYFDDDSSGTKAFCGSAAVGRDALAGFTAWLRHTGHRGFLGEFGASSNPVCLAALEQTLDHMQANADVWQGWTYWAAGDWYGDYMFNVMPPDPAKHPQVTVLKKFLAD